jgi:hypothetical protein
VNLTSPLPLTSHKHRQAWPANPLADAIDEWMIDEDPDDLDEAVPMLRQQAADASFE